MAKDVNCSTELAKAISKLLVPREPISIFPIDPQVALQPDPGNRGEYYLNAFTGAHPGLFAGVWAAEEQETVIGSYPVRSLSARERR